MSVRAKALLVPVLAGALLMGCADAGNKETMGTLIGAGIGNAIGRNMDKVDRMEMERAQYQAFEYTPSGTSTKWYNPDTGNSGWVKPAPAYKDESGQYCREYQQKVTINGQEQQAYGRACRKPDGSWEIIS